MFGLSPTWDRYCHKCADKTPQTIAQKEMRSGRYHYQWWCFHDHAASQWIPKEMAFELLSGNPPYEIENEDIIPCQHCSGRGAEAHHIAPRHLFEDADTWPLFFLCPTCHDLWHRKCTPHKSEVGLFRSALSKEKAAVSVYSAAYHILTRLQQRFNYIFVEKNNDEEL